MSHKAWFILFLIILSAILYDVIFRGSEDVIFLLKKLFELIDYIATWR